MRYVPAGAGSVLVLIAALLSGVAIACDKGDAKDIKEAALLAVYERFNSCRGLDAVEAVSCVANTMAADSPPKLNEKITKWLLDLDSLGSLEACPHEVVRLFPRAGESRYAAIRCVAYTAFGREHRALFYFVEEDGALRIAGVQKLRL